MNFTKDDIEVVKFWKIQDSRIRDSNFEFIFKEELLKQYRNYSWDIYEIDGIKIHKKYYSLLYQTTIKEKINSSGVDANAKLYKD